MGVVRTVHVGELEVLVSSEFFRRSELECQTVSEPNRQSVGSVQTVGQERFVPGGSIR
jgi:hypothetical protein